MLSRRWFAEARTRVFASIIYNAGAASDAATSKNSNDYHDYYWWGALGKEKATASEKYGEGRSITCGSCDSVEKDQAGRERKRIREEKAQQKPQQEKGEIPRVRGSEGRRRNVRGGRENIDDTHHPHSSARRRDSVCRPR